MAMAGEPREAAGLLAALDTATRTQVSWPSPHSCDLGCSASELEAAARAGAAPAVLPRSPPVPRLGGLLRVAAVVALCAGVAACLALTAGGSGQFGRVKAAGSGLTRMKPASILAKYDPLVAALVDAGVPGLPGGEDTDTLFPEKRADADTGGSIGGISLMTPAPAIVGGIAVTTPATATVGGIAVTTAPLLFNASCSNNEEIFGGLCYKTCQNMTNGTHPFRTSAYSCCETQSVLYCLMPSYLKTGLALPGMGYDIDGSGGVPHPPGFCHDNEEIYLDKCYLKCSVLTSGEFPMRSAPNTCCKKKPCLSFYDVQTSGTVCTGFDVCGQRKGAEYECPHLPFAKPPVNNQ